MITFRIDDEVRENTKNLLKGYIRGHCLLQTEMHLDRTDAGVEEALTDLDRYLNLRCIEITRKSICLKPTPVYTIILGSKVIDVTSRDDETYPYELSFEFEGNRFFELAADEDIQKYIWDFPEVEFVYGKKDANAELD